MKKKHVEDVVERPNGERGQVVPAPQILSADRSKIAGAIKPLYDITNRKRGETAAMRLAAVVQSSHDAIVAKDLNGTITDWNQSAERIFGYKAKEIIGKSILTLIPTDRHKEETEILSKIRRGELIDHYETVRRRKDGRLIDVSLTISPVKDLNGQIVGVSKIARDITKQKQTDRRLAEQARLLDLSNDAILVRDAQDRIIYWNRGAQEMYGYSAGEALGKVTHTLLRTKHPQPLARIREKLEREGRWSGELVHVRKDGAKITIMSRWVLDRDAKGKKAAVLETNSDITVRKHAEAAAHRLQEISRLLIQGADIDALYRQILDAAVGIMRSDFGSLQMLHPDRGEDGELQLLFFRGFNPKAAKFWEWVRPGSETTCGKTLRTSQRCVVPDVEKCDFMAGSADLKMYLQTGIHAVQTTPLVSRSGKLLGMISTHWRKAYEPPERDFRLFDVLARQAADVIERRQADEALRQKDDELEMLVTQTPFMLTRCTRDLRYRYVSRAYAEMFGRKPEEIAGKPIAEIMGEKGLKTILPYVQKVLKGHTAETEVLYQGVGTHWLHCAYTPDWDSNGNVIGWFASLIDISERKKAEAVLQNSRRVLEKLVRERTRELHVANQELQAEMERRKGLEGEILAVSDREQQRLGQELHDGICQHLTAVAFMARSVAMRLKNHRVIDAIDIEKIAELVNDAAADTRELSRALHRADVDAAGLVDALQDLIDREIWRTPSRLQVHPSFHLEDDATATQLYRIAREAVINANKHAQARQIVIGLRGGRKGTALTVTDDGIGLQNEQNGARGLGFHIMHYRAHMMGGQLKTERPKQGGTRVACYLPNKRQLRKTDAGGNSKSRPLQGESRRHLPR